MGRGAAWSAFLWVRFWSIGPSGVSFSLRSRCGVAFSDLVVLNVHFAPRPVRWLYPPPFPRLDFRVTSLAIAPGPIRNALSIGDAEPIQQIDQERGSLLHTKGRSAN